MRVAVLGGGNGAFATAGDLTLRGHKVWLCELPELTGGIAALTARPVLDVECLPSTGLRSGEAHLAGVTADPDAALEEAETVLLIVPAYAHRRFAEFIGPSLRPDHAVVVAPGNLWGSTRLARDLWRAGAPRDVLVGEAECMIYATRKSGPTSLTIRGFKENLAVAAVDPARTAELAARLRPLYPTIRAVATVVETGLGNVNPFLHPPILLSNLGRMTGGAGFRFYADGVSEPVAEIIEALDVERMAVAKALGAAIPPLRSLLVLWYGHEGAAGESLYSVIHSVPAYHCSMAPAQISDTRYLFEDIPYGLSVLARAAAATGVAAPVTDALIAVARALAGTRREALNPPEPTEEEQQFMCTAQATV